MIFDRGLVAAARGSLTLFSDFEDEGPMWAGTGPREVRRRVDYGLTFIEAPVVHVGLSMWDVSNQANVRVQLTAEEVEDTGFTASFRTWSDSRLARVAISWLAVGMVRDPDQWSL